MRQRERGPRWPLTMELLIAPFGGLCVVLLCFLFPGAAAGWRLDPDMVYCLCGTPLGRRPLPRLEGPDPIERGPALSVYRKAREPGPARGPAGRWVAWLDSGDEVDDPQDELSTWPKLRGLLEVKRHGWKLTHPSSEERPPVDLLLAVDPALPIHRLRPCLQTLDENHHRRLLLVFRHKGRHSGGRVLLDEPSRGALRLSSFASYGDLASEVVRLRQAGRPVRLAVADAER